MAERSIALAGAEPITPRPKRGAAGTQPARRLAPVELELPFDVVASKLVVPPVRTGTVAKSALLTRLRATHAYPVATLVAPAGYGKTTLLAQWAGRDTRPFAWVSLDPRDNDALVLLRHVAAALDRIDPLDARALQPLRKRTGSLWEAAVPRLGARIASPKCPFVMVLDNADVLTSAESLEVAQAMVAHVPHGSMVVLSARAEPQLPLAALRGEGRLLEVGVDTLALAPREARALLRGAGATIDGDDPRLRAVVKRCEGWPLALFFAARSLRRAHRLDASRECFTGEDRDFTDYLRSEYLARLSPDVVRFLRRTSVLERMSGPLCDAVLEGEGSGVELEKLERAHLLVFAVDERRVWYRTHPLVRDVLRRELSDLEPLLLPVLHSRAANWFEARGDDGATLEHAAEAGDEPRVAALLDGTAFRVYNGGGVVELERRLARFDPPAALAHYPAVALHGARVHAFRGRSADAERWLAVAEAQVPTERACRDARDLAARAHLLHAVLCHEGPAAMLADAELAARDLRPQSEWLPLALLLGGVAHMLAGDDERADAVLADAAEHAGRARCAATRVLALAERAALAASRADHDAAEMFAQRARAAANRLGGYGEAALAHAVAGRALLRRGRWDEARGELASAAATVPALTEAVPWLAVQTRIELGHAWLALRDGEAALATATDARNLLRLRPQLGSLDERVRELTDALGAFGDGDSAPAAGLTPAELRLLPLLATHLAFREIGERLFVSRNTVKTQAISIYRKLGVSRRSDAIAAAARLGLGDLDR